MTDAIVTSGMNFEPMVREVMDSDTRLSRIPKIIRRVLYQDAQGRLKNKSGSRLDDWKVK